MPRRKNKWAKESNDHQTERLLLRVFTRLFDPPLSPVPHHIHNTMCGMYCYKNWHWPFVGCPLAASVPRGCQSVKGPRHLDIWTWKFIPSFQFWSIERRKKRETHWNEVFFLFCQCHVHLLIFRTVNFVFEVVLNKFSVLFVVVFIWLDARLQDLFFFFLIGKVWIKERKRKTRSFFLFRLFFPPLVCADAFFQAAGYGTIHHQGTVGRARAFPPSNTTVEIIKKKTFFHRQQKPYHN